MKLRAPILNCQPPGRAVSPLTADGSQASDGAHGVTRPADSIGNRRSEIENGFTLVEILVVVVLLSLIVLALMAVFNGTQAAFRAGITQTDVLEGGRSVMGLIKSDLEEMVPAFGRSNIDLSAGYYGFVPFNTPVNFTAVLNQYEYQSGTQPLVQSLIGSDASTRRTNVLQKIFFITRQNTTWTGVGYFVDTAAADYLNPLYRFSLTTNTMAPDAPWVLYATFLTNSVLPVSASATNLSLSHLVDGVVHLTVRPYNPDGYCMTNLYVTNVTARYSGTNRNVWFTAPAWGEVGCYMFSNTVPASVQIELGLLEDRAIQRAESLPDATPTWVRSNYLAQQSGKVHLFRQRVPIRNVDPSAFQ